MIDYKQLISRHLPFAGGDMSFNFCELLNNLITAKLSLRT